jgi:hypothetical protein
MEKLGSNLGPITAENQVKPWSVTQNQAKRINEIVLLLSFREQPRTESITIPSTTYIAT